MEKLINNIINEKRIVSIAYVYKYCEKNNMLNELKEWQTLIIGIINQHNHSIELEKRLINEVHPFG